MAACLGDVLVKVSGDPTILDDRRLPALAAHAADYATGLDHRDRMSGIAHHDEQGSSDRPYNLTVRFDPARIDGGAAHARPRAVARSAAGAGGAGAGAGGRDAFDLTDGEPRADGMRAALAGAGRNMACA